MVEICQQELPFRPWEDEHTRRLPGLTPTAPGEWLWVDDAYGAQMNHRRQLMSDKGDAVHRLSETALPAAQELLETVLEELRARSDFEICAERVICPDRAQIEINRAAPLLTVGALVQEDFVIMEKIGDEHVLTGAILCFPASWTLEQKFLQPMTRIHVPVEEYTPEIARRVQRLFDGIQVGRPMWRANALVYGDPELHQPRREEDKRGPVQSGRKFLRVERQGMRRLPKTRAVIFSIHSFVLRDTRLAELGIRLPQAERA
ncbi:DUF3445 domain-containing protein [Aliiroseovarius crassostreae]|uniref:DUF3445 domain-containing protein n=1 Tax=Aliiroseovarius crassostreae TaxID=154981 RepID=A0A9Q9LUH5_9RHOB|nr:DUF3445 domain-containing protein [Aliiroseovarius crassostreae]UWP96345.1 DUF3445 domain-containing protein [Aliiroseovarius crassostreae]